MSITPPRQRPWYVLGRLCKHTLKKPKRNRLSLTLRPFDGAAGFCGEPGRPGAVKNASRCTVYGINGAHGRESGGKQIPSNLYSADVTQRKKNQKNRKSTRNYSQNIGRGFVERTLRVASTGFWRERVTDGFRTADERYARENDDGKPNGATRRRHLVVRARCG